MCGIVGYIGEKTAQDVLITELKRLEYRGYDSAGIMTLSPQHSATLLRAKGKVSALVDIASAHTTTDTMGIGHTRWATHGAPSERNAHPHQVGNIYVVHNGIIENYQELKTMLAYHDYTFKSDTDTEVLTALIDYMYRETHDTLAAVTAALKMVVGAYGIAVVHTDNPDEIIVARKGSPLIVGLGEGETYIASDASALVGYTKQVVYLHDGEIGRCTKSGLTLQTIQSKAVDVHVETLEMDLQAIQKQGFDHFLLKEIFDQPRTVQATLAGRVIPDQGYARLGGINLSDDQLRAIKHVMIVGCGTAYFAGMQASYFIEQMTDDVTVSVEIASELRYRSYNIPDHTVALIVSQSGETADTLACLMELKRRGVLCLGVVNAVGSTIAREVDSGVYVHVGAEISVASTKAFTSQVAAMTIFGVMLAAAKGASPQLISEFVNELGALPGEIKNVLDTNIQHIHSVAQLYASYVHALYIGRDTLYPAAMEGALKLKEVSYIHAEAYAAGELKHGPIALIDDRFFEICYLQDNWLYEKSQSNLIEMNARGAHAIVITDTIKDIPAETMVRITTKFEHLTPLLFNVVSQLFAYYMALARGNDVDQPRNLAKSVTVE